MPAWGIDLMEKSVRRSHANDSAAGDGGQSPEGTGVKQGADPLAPWSEGDVDNLSIIGPDDVPGSLENSTPLNACSRPIQSP